MFEGCRTRVFTQSRKPWRGTKLLAIAFKGFGGVNRTDYRFAKRSFRSACDTDGPTAGALTTYQNFESVADCILSQW
jgi:hypothetical protein